MNDTWIYTVEFFSTTAHCWRIARRNVTKATADATVARLAAVGVRTRVFTKQVTT